MIRQQNIWFSFLLKSSNLKRTSLAFVMMLLLMHAEAQQISVSAEILNPDSLLIGDHIGLVISAEHETGVKLFWPSFYDTINRLEIVRVEKVDTLVESGKIKMSQKIVVSAYDSGIYLIQPISFVYQLQGNTEFDTISTRPLFIPVHTLQVDTSQGIAPIKDPLAVPFSIREIIPILLAIWILSIIFILLYYFVFRKKKVKEVLLRPKPTIPPHILAKQKLQELEAEKLWQKGEVKLYYIKLSEIVREYIEFRYDTLALESTTDEIIESLRDKDIQQNDVHLLESLLDLSDMVKFAKFTPLPDKHTFCMNQAEDFVNHTKQMEITKETEGAHV